MILSLQVFTEYFPLLRKKREKIIPPQGTWVPGNILYTAISLHVAISLKKSTLVIFKGGDTF